MATLISLAALDFLAAEIHGFQPLESHCWTFQIIYERLSRLLDEDASNIADQLTKA
jgi:hypothetical protein